MKRLSAILTVLLLLASACFGAISANTVLEVRTAGSDTNGGGFVTGASGTDYSQQDAKNTVGNNISTTDAVAVGTTSITSATASFTSAIVGNIVYFAGGTGSITGVWRQVATFTNSTTIVLDASIAASTGMTMNIGGALGSPGQAAAIIVAANKIWIKNGTYSITSASTNISGGCVSVTSSTQGTSWQGYASTRGDLGTAPLLQANGISTFTIITAGSSSQAFFENIAVDGASLTSSQGFKLNTAHGYLLTAKNCTNNGFSGAATTVLVGCYATGCSTQPAFSSISVCIGCEASANTVSGFSATNTIACLSINNTGASSDGFSVNPSAQYCTAYGNGRDGFRSGTAASHMVGCIAEANTGKGFNDGGNNSCIFQVCGTYNNTGGATSLTGNGSQNLNTIANTTGSFFVAPGSGNFALNNLPSQGQLARNAGIPGAFPDGLTTGYVDLGAAQHIGPGTAVGTVARLRRAHPDLSMARLLRLAQEPSPEPLPAGLLLLPGAVLAGLVFAGVKRI